ncbi:hypothetical protein XENORESO_017361 [Xenotaenia resolanae]|uniref:Nebulin n=1 Tax=Xenotaenia resolanae TaxID=208358 RepID=A0ABV0VS13_9TELE
MADTGDDYDEFEEEEDEEFMEQSGLPTRKVRRKAKVDTSKFMTPYLAHSQKMLELFSHNKYRQAYDLSRGAPTAFITDTPELIRIRKAQEQLSEVKYRMEGNKARTTSLYGGEAREVIHVKHVSELISKVLYRQKWDETKDRYLLPPDAPELVLAVKNAANYSKKLYTEAWDEEKTLYYPYTDSPELRRVAKAQEVLSDVKYKKGHDERKAKYTSLPDPPEMELAKRVAHQRSDLKYKEDYNKNVRGQWCETPYFDVAIARMAMDNLSDRKYTQHHENIKDQIYFMQTDTPVYDACKKARIAASEVQYKKEYEKNKAQCDYNTLPATENPLLRQLRYAGTILSDKVYKASYEKSRGFSINYCDTPKFQMDSVLKKFSDVRYKEKYDNEVKGHYVGSYEDLYMVHCQKVEEMKSEHLYKADYEDIKTRCFFPQTITPEYEAGKKLLGCSDKVYRQHPDKVKFTQVVDSPVLVQASINAKQLSDLNYKAKFEQTKFKCNLPPDYPFFIQSRVNAFNLSDSCYKYDWEKSKAKKFEIKGDAIPILAARAHTNIVSDVKYKKEYEKNRGQMIGALSINDDPKILHSVHVAKIQSDREYKKNYEKIKTKYHTPLDMISVTMAKKSQAIASMAGYRKINPNYFLPHDSVLLDLAKKANSIQSDNEYKAEYNSYVKGSPWVPYGSMDVEKAKKAAEILNERKYRQHPDTIPFTSIDDHPIMLQAKVNQLQRSDLFYKRGLEEIHQKYSLPPDTPEFLQAKCNAYNISKNYYKYAWEELIAKGYDLKPDAIPIVAAKAARHAVSNVTVQTFAGYKQHHHNYFLLPDAMNLQLARTMNYNASDNNYKMDYETSVKGTGWVPIGSLDVEKAKAAAAALDERKYRQHPSTIKFTSVTDSMNMELAKTNAKILNEREYKASGEKIMHTYHLPSDTPELMQARYNAVNISQNYYTYAHRQDILKGHHVKEDAIPVLAAKSSRDIASNNVYKSEYNNYFKGTGWVPIGSLDVEKAKSARAALDDRGYRQHPSSFKFTSKTDDMNMSLALANTKQMDQIAYKASGEKFMHTYHLPADSPEFLQAKFSAQTISESHYKRQWLEDIAKGYDMRPDAIPILHAKQGRHIASNTMAGYRKIPHSHLLLPDNMHLQLCRNMNVLSSDVSIIETAKVGGEIQNERKYRQHPSGFKFSKLMDSMDLALATANNQIMNKKAYTSAWEKDKLTIHIMPDSPEIVLAKANALTMSNKLYKAGVVEMANKGYNLKADAIPIVAAKSGTTIASNVMDMLSVVHAKQASAAQTMTGYRHIQHTNALLPDAMGLELARTMNLNSSDWNYKAEWNNYIKGIGWVPIGSLSVETAKVGGEILSEKKYRTHPSNFKYSKLMDSMDVALATVNNQIMNKKAYTAAWEKDKLKVHVMPDSPEIVLAKANALTMSNKLYKAGVVEMANKGYNLKADAIPIVAAKSGTTIASNYKYKLAYEKARGHHVGFRSLRDDPLLVHYMEVAKIQSDKVYKKDYHKAKLKYHTPVDMLSVVHAKQASAAQTMAGYRQIQHTNALLPDAMGLELARNMQFIASDNEYKKEYESYIKGIGWVPIGSLDVEKAKTAGQALNEKLYRKHPSNFKFTKDMHSMDLVLATANNQIMDKKSYTKAWDKDKTSIHIMPDAMDVVLARDNKKNYSEKLYKLDNELAKKKGHNLRADAIAIQAAKASTIIASDAVYKEDLKMLQGIGWVPIGSLDVEKVKKAGEILSEKKYRQHPSNYKFKSTTEDMPMALAKANAQIINKKSYTEAWEKDKTSIHVMPDAMDILLAKANKVIYSEKIYKQANEEAKKKGYDLRNDAISIIAARASRDIASDAVYKEDLRLLQGIGWVPIGSLDVEKVKKAGEILSENKYRQHPSNFRFKSTTEDMPMVLAKANAQVINKKAYIEAWDNDKTKIHVMPDAMDVVLAKANSYHYSLKNYKKANEDAKKKGYDLRGDAISIIAARTSRDIASDAVYKEDLRLMQGIGWVPIGSLDVEKVKKAGEVLSERKYRQHPSNYRFKSTTEDMPLVLAKANAQVMNKKAYIEAWENEKTNIHVMPDAMDILLAKANNVNYSVKKYKQANEDAKKKGYDLRGDAISIIAAKASRDIASDAIYKADLKWLQGLGWVPIGSLDVEKAKKAAEVLSERQYRQHPSTVKFTSPIDAMNIVLAKNNALTMNKKLYRQGFEETIKKGYFLPPDAVSVKAAKASRDIVSDAVYKADLDEVVGVGWIPIGSLDVVKAKNAAKILNDRLYRQKPDTFKYKTDMTAMPMVLAKTNAETINKKSYIAAWEADKIKTHVTPDLPELLLSKANAYNISRKNYREAVEDMFRKGYDMKADAAVYKADMEWIKGMGWVPIGSLDVEKAKKAAEILSDRKYRQHPSKFKFTAKTSDMPYALAQANAQIMNKKAYTEAWEKDKINLHILPDTLEILLAKQNKLNTSLKYYREGFVDAINKGYVLPKDAVSVVAAKASRDIVSDYKYKAGFRKQCGHHIGALSVKDDPLSMLAAHVAKISSDNIYKKDFHKTKTKYHLPVDMLTIELAKKCQQQVNDFNYRTHLHQWTCLPDSNDVVQARKVYDLQSDAVYKADLEWLRGCGWSPQDCLDVVKVKNAQTVLNERLYRQQPSTVKFTSVVDLPAIVLSKQNADNLSDRKYREVWDKDKLVIHIPPDIPPYELAKANAITISNKLYTQAWDNQKAKAFHIKEDAIAVLKAKASRDIISDAVYKADMEWIRGCGWMPHECVDVVKVKHAQKILADRGYRVKLDEQKFTVPADRVDMACAKNAAEVLNEAKYREAWHQDKIKYTLVDTPGLATAREVAKNIHPNVYRADLEWIRGCGWVAADSVDHVKVKKAQEILNDRLYKKNAQECFGKFSLIVDRPEIVLAKINAANLSDVRKKGHYIGSEDTPQLAHSREMAKTISEKLYKSQWDKTKATSYSLNHEYIPLLSGKKGREIASDVKYKDSHEKAKGHYMAGTLVDFPEVVRCGQQEKNKGLVFYKDDLNWMKGIGCYVWDTPEIIRAKKSYELQSDLKYRADAKKDFNNYSIVTDTPEYVTAVLGHTWASDLNYREAYHKEKHMYTTVLDTHDYARCHDFKLFFSNKNYTAAWDKIKAKSYQIPADANALQHAKQQKVVLSNVKYKEDYEKFKSLYSLPKSLEDDPATARCVKAGKLVLDIFYKDDLNWLKGIGCYAWDTPEILRVKHAGVLQSEATYRAKGIEAFKDYTVVMDTPVYETAKQNAQNLSDVGFPLLLPQLHYRLDYNANVKGKHTSPAVTMETERARLANHIQSNNWYTGANKNFMPTGYSLPSDTPLIKQAKMNSVVTSNVKYKEAFEMVKAKAYTLHPEGVNFVTARKAHKIINDRLYREAYHKQKDKIHTIYDTPDLCYKEKYYNSRGQLISMPITPQLMHCRHVNDITSELRYKEDLMWLRGMGCFLYDTPEMVHVRNITKQRVRVSFLLSVHVLLSPVAHLSYCLFLLLQTSYPVEAKKNLSNFTVVLDTPEYNRVTELKTHMSDYQYTDLASKERAHFTPETNTPNIQHARKMKVVYSETKYKEQYEKMKHRYTAIADTPILIRSKKAYLQSSDLRYKETFELSKGHYHTDKDALDIVCHRKVTDDISEVKYREKYINSLGTWKSIPDRPEFFFSKIANDNVSNVKYKEDLEWLKGIGCYVWDTPELLLADRNKALYSERLYRASFEKNRGNFKYTCDTPFFEAARNASVLINDRIYRANYEKTKDKFTITTDDPTYQLARENRNMSQVNVLDVLSDRPAYLHTAGPPDCSYWCMRSVHMGVWSPELSSSPPSDVSVSQFVLNCGMLCVYICHCVCGQKKYKSRAKDLLKNGCNELLRPDILTALCQSIMGSKWKYREQYERAKDKFTSVLETPEYEAHKRSKKITDIIYRMEYNKTKAKGYTLPYDTPHQQHMKKVKEITSNLKYKEVYEKSKAQINMDPEAHEIRAAKEAYKNISNLDYKKKYEATKNKWIWTTDRPDFLNAAKNSLQQSDVEYKYDKEMMKGCVIPVSDDKYTLLYKKNAEIASDVKYKEKYEKTKGHYIPVMDTPQILHAKAVRTLVSESKYKQESKKIMQSGSFTTLAETRDTAHSREVKKLVSEKQYKQKFEKEKGKSVYNQMIVPPDVQHAMDVAKNQSNVAYKKDAKANLHYTTVVDRPDIKKATQAAKLISEIGYREKAREEASRGGSLINRPDIALATHVSQLTSQV